MSERPIAAEEASIVDMLRFSATRLVVWRMITWRASVACALAFTVASAARANEAAPANILTTAPAGALPAANSDTPQPPAGAASAPAQSAPAPVVPPPAAAPPAAAPVLPPPPPTPKPAGTRALVVDLGTMEAAVGKSVRSAAGEDMGHLVDIVVDANGQVRAAVIDFGGVLGVGSRKVAVDWHTLDFASTMKDGPIKLTLTRNQVRVGPEYRSGEPIVILESATSDVPPGPPASSSASPAVIAPTASPAKPPDPAPSSR